MSTPKAWNAARIAVEHRECDQDAAIAKLGAMPHRWIEWDGTVEAWVGGARLASTAEQGSTTWLLAAEAFDPNTGESIKVRRRGNVVDLWSVREVASAGTERTAWRPWRWVRPWSVREGAAAGTEVRFRETRHVSNLVATSEGRALNHRIYARREETSFDPSIAVWRPWVAAFRGFVS